VTQGDTLRCARGTFGPLVSSPRRFTRMRERMAARRSRPWSESFIWLAIFLSVSVGIAAIVAVARYFASRAAP